MTDISHILKWLDERRAVNSFTVTEVPLHELGEWSLTDGQYVHKTGKFFKVQGLEVETNYGYVDTWCQPIINQPEIGILGIIYKNGKYLLQAKMEPGNINILQLSPTVQATESNYKQVHDGKRTRYLECFLGPLKGNVIVDRIQSEQGGRFLEKVNRNMIVDVSTQVIDVHDDYIWVTIYELQELLKLNNVVNMDTRSVLSCALQKNEDLIIRHLDSNAIKHPSDILNWISELRARYFLKAKQIPLAEMDGWHTSLAEIRDPNGRHFSVVGVQVEADNREVTSWSQPIFKEMKCGMAGFLIARINAVDHYLVQATVEPGKRSISLTSTVQCSDYENKEDRIDYLNYFLQLDSNILHDSVQSEEGGRFFQFQNRNMVVEVNADEINVHGNYFWMSYNEVVNFINHGHFNIEARTLMACYKFPGGD